MNMYESYSYDMDIKWDAPTDALVEAIDAEIEKRCARWPKPTARSKPAADVLDEYLSTATREELLAWALEWQQDWADEARRTVTLRADLAALTNNVERVVTILTPLFVKAQEADSADEEPLGGALDVLTGWFGQNGKPLRKLDDLQAENERLKAKVERLTAYIEKGHADRQPDVDHLLAENQRVKADADDLHARLVQKAAENERLRAGWDEAQVFMALALEREERQAEQIALLQEALQDIANHVPSIDRAYRVATESLARLAADAPAHLNPECGLCVRAECTEHTVKCDAPVTEAQG